RTPLSSLFPYTTLFRSSLMENLRQATEHESVYSEDLVRHLVNAIIVIAARNLALIKPKNIIPHADIRLLQILEYIQEHIRQPELDRKSTRLNSSHVKIS